MWKQMDHGNYNTELEEVDHQKQNKTFHECHWQIRRNRGLYEDNNEL